jgi:hypothetical protein
MTIQELILLASNRLAALNTARSTAVGVGNVQRLNDIDAEITETQATLDKLNTL